MIRFDNLRKEFGDLVAVEGLDAVIPEGEIFGLIGPNGAGKTTTIRMACGLLEPTGGRAFVAGIDVQEQPEQAHLHIGYLSDFFSVYEDLKVWEYLDYFAHAHKMDRARIPGRIDQVIHEAGLDVKRDAFIKGLSRGMKQRLGIARAIIHQPKVLLLDEPASGLDPKARMELRDILRALRDNGATILISSHILTELEGFCTSIGLMEKGRMVRHGTIAQITSQAIDHIVVRVNWAGDGSGPVATTLGGHPAIAGLQVKASEAIFQFSGPREDLAAVLKDLIGAGVAVVFFGEVKHTVEDLYLKLSRHEVM